MLRQTLTVLLLGLAACGQGDGATEAPPSATATAATTTPSATASVTASASASAAPSASASAAAEKDWGCGKKGQELCPMQGWMKTNVSSAVSKADTDALAKALDVIAAHPVEGYDEWVKISEEGAAAAREGDLQAAKKSCKGCHKLYQKDYKRTQRDAPWPQKR